MATLPILFTLITVTYGGIVHHSDGYTSDYMCEEARSLALTGETIEYYKDAEAEWIKTAPNKGIINPSNPISGIRMIPSFSPNQGEMIIRQHGDYIVRYSGDIKTAECIKVPDTITVNQTP